MKIGYARVSTTGQDYATQIEKLRAAGCEDENIYTEKQSGKSADNRGELQAAIKFVRKGDVLVVTKLDRLARSMNDLTSITDQLNKKGVGFIVTDQEIDTTTPTGKLLFNILGSLAEFERDLINARTAEGRKAAKAKGVKFGRKAKLTAAQVAELKVDFNAGELPKQAIAEKYGVTRKTVYRLVG